jgi:hypothetical protein
MVAPPPSSWISVTRMNVRTDQYNPRSVGQVSRRPCNSLFGANKSLIHLLVETEPGFFTAKEPWLTPRSLAPMRRIGQSDSVMRLPTGRSGTELSISRMEGAAVGPISGGGGTI